MRQKEHGRDYDPAVLAVAVRGAVRDVVRNQAAAGGLDVVTDGEQGKVSFLTYVKERLSGFEEVEGEPLVPASWRREIDDFPDYDPDAHVQVLVDRRPHAGHGLHRPGRLYRPRRVAF